MFAKHPFVKWLMIGMAFSKKRVQIIHFYHQLGSIYGQARFKKLGQMSARFGCRDRLVAVGMVPKGTGLTVFFADSFADYANLLVHPDFEEAGRLLIAQMLNSGDWRKGTV